MIFQVFARVQITSTSTIPSQFLNKTIKLALSAKDLGLTLDSHISYDEHISTLISSCMRKLHQINRVKDSLDKETLLLCIETLVIGKSLYCCTVWSNTSAMNIKKLQTVQNFACRIITKQGSLIMLHQVCAMVTGTTNPIIQRYCDGL